MQSIRFDDWKLAIHAANDIDQVMRVVRAYLGAWGAEDLAILPTDAAAIYVETPEDVIARAAIACRAEVTSPPDTDTTLLREMALTLSAASTRIRRLTAEARASAFSEAGASLVVRPSEIDLR